MSGFPTQPVRIRWLLSHVQAAAVLCVLVTCAKAATISEQCATDLEAIPGFLLENDTGAKDELAQWGQAHFETALAKAREDAAKAQDVEACNKTLNAYLKAWRKGHLAVADVPRANTLADAPGKVEASLVPTIRLLSDTTALLTIPTFAGEFREPLIHLIAQHRKALVARTNWIIDVRDNDGGNDSTYYPLLPWLMPDERENVGAAWLATPANIVGQELVCSFYEPGDKECEKYSAEAMMRMRAVAPGSYAQQEDDPAIHYVRVEKLEPHRPGRVAVLVDGRCGSSCEEFLLTVRQSFSVKLVGRHSHGSLDYSNVRPHVLPSGERVLLYATSRSNRLPVLPVDVAGVQPDIYLPEPPNEEARKNEVLQVQRWLERGSLAPTATITSRPNGPIH
ncbi:MAG TPA: S41 family peptidase [Steroidobacteraceae bacterium]|jgi:hypothetical protein|nr:S41 family peptidase [Steroidobacteraceae bacterium]